MATCDERSWRSWLVSIFSIVGVFTPAIFFDGNYAVAQIVPDETLSENPSTITPNVNIQGLPADRIDGGVSRGANLFHSFREFNVGDNQRVYFSNPTGIENILTRVTGRNVSNILGTLGVDGGSANLFLINPNGLIFGQNARLDVRGSFVASTANAIQFGNQGFFSATTPENPSSLLSVNPSALFFNQLQASKIENKSIAPLEDNQFGLQVRDGRSLLLIGGDIAIDGGRLNALGGRIELAAIVGNGTVGLNFDANNQSLSIPDSVARADISLTNKAALDVRSGNGGSIAVNARNLNILEGSSLDAGIGAGLGSVASQAGDIALNATAAIKIINSNVRNMLNTGALGNTGNILLRTSELEVADTSQMSVRDRDRFLVEIAEGTKGTGVLAGIARGAKGVGGNLTITAEKLDVSGTAVQLATATTGEGNSGNLTVEIGELVVRDGARISASSFGVGNSGNLTIDATNIVAVGRGSRIAARVNLGAQGRGGNLTINTNRLSITDAAQVSASTDGIGNAGNLTINATDTVTMVRDSRISAQVNPEAQGHGGNLTINTTRLSISDGAQVSTPTFGIGNAGNLTINAADVELSARVNVINPLLSGLVAGASQGSRGNAGNLTINTNRLSVINGALVVVSTLGIGKAGNLIVKASNVEVSGKSVEKLNGITAYVNSGLFALVEQGGKGGEGNLTIKTDRLSVSDGAEVSTSTFGIGNAGNLTIHAADTVAIDQGGTITAQVDFRAEGNGGNLTIKTNYLSISNGAEVSVSSQGSGNAGNLEATARSIRLNNLGKLTAQTKSGQGGNITVLAQDLLLLRNGSQISTTAGNRQFGGDGGNIIINSPFIVAVPQENSDITANAFTGKGGRVDITANSIFGIVPQERPTLLSDITASSEFGVQGFVTINTPDVDPARGLVQLPANLVDASQQIASGCTPRGQQASRFIATGRGGLPLSPDEPLRGRAVITNWVNLPATNNVTELTPSPPTIVEAQELTVSDRGEVMLVAQSPQTNYSHSSAITCSQ